MKLRIKEPLNIFEPETFVDQNQRKWLATIAFEANGAFFTSALSEMNNKAYYVFISTPMSGFAKYKFGKDYDHNFYTNGSYFNAASEFTKLILATVDIY